MNSVKFYLIVGLVVGLLLPHAALYAQKGLYIEYILDASNSMNEPLPSGEAKIDVAKKVVCNLIDNIAAEAKGNVNIGLRIYGANFDPTGTKEKACRDSVLEVPIAGIKADIIKQKVTGLKAEGYTPIAYSLELASKDFPAGEGDSNIIILVSDGQETCGGDPVGVIKKLKEQGFEVVVHCIGFAVEEEARKQLEAIAQASGGLYYSAENADQLNVYLKKVTERAFEEYEAAGEKVEPGALISKAPGIEPGDYQWKIRMQEVNFYKVKVYKGQKIKASLIVKKTPYSAMNSIINQTFSVKLFNDVFSEVASEDCTVKGNPEDPATFKAQWEADRTGWVYIAVSATKNHSADGNPNSLYPADLVPEPSSYTLKVKVKGDIAPEEEGTEFVIFPEEEKKGGSGFDKAQEVKPDTAYNNVIYMNEVRYYKLPVKEGMKRVKVTAVVTKPWYNAHNSYINMKYTVKIYDEDWVEMGSKEVIISKNPAKPFSINAESDIGDNDEVYVSLIASKNFSAWDNNEVSIYPEEFIPEPQKYTILITTE